VKSSGCLVQHTHGVCAPRWRNPRDRRKGSRVAAAALSEPSEAADNWTMGWALHVLTTVTADQGQLTDALPPFDRVLAVTQDDPALTDLRLLLQINQAVTLGDLDRYEEAIAVGQVRARLASTNDRASANSSA
jgi:hypothetical protein